MFGYCSRVSSDQVTSSQLVPVAVNARSTEVVCANALPAQARTASVTTRLLFIVLSSRAGDRVERGFVHRAGRGILQRGAHDVSPGSMPGEPEGIAGHQRHGGLVRRREDARLAGRDDREVDHPEGPREAAGFEDDLVVDGNVLQGAEEAVPVRSDADVAAGGEPCG